MIRTTVEGLERVAAGVRQRLPRVDTCLGTR